jgi:predicted secreted protein
MDLSREAVERMLAGAASVSLNGRDLGGIDLSGLSLDGADFSYAILERAKLARASLKGSILWSARAGGADLSGSDLRGAKLGAADLSGADLRGADLRGATLLGANLSFADLRGADLRQTDASRAIVTRAVEDGATRWPEGFQIVREPMGNEFVLGPADRGTVIEVRPGDTVRIRLPENPTTGYRWQVAADSGAALGAIASLVHQSFADAATSAAGAAGERTLVFEAKTPGRASLRLVNKPSWRGDDAAAEDFALELVVKP